MKEIGPRFDSKPDQPEDCGEMTNKEIDDERREILESEQFGCDFLEYIGDNLTPEQAGKLGNDLVNCDLGAVGQYITTLFKRGAEETIRRIQEAK